jgi:hypothetical protein
MDVISQNDDKAFMKMYPKSKKGQSMVQIAMFPYNLDLKQFKKQVSEGKMGDYALVGKKDDKVVDVGRLKDMRNQRVKMGRNKYDVYPARGSTPGDTFVTTACPPVNEENTMNQDLIDAVAKIMGEAKEKTPRQLVDPRKEVMVVKKNKVIVIDKKDQEKYMRMGYGLAEKTGDKEKYTKFFNAALKKFGVDSPADFKDEKKKKEFFDYVDKNYVGDHEEQMKKENYEIGKDYGKHTREVTPGQSNDDFNKMVDVMQKKNTSMREALAKVWGMDEGKSPFKKEEKPMGKTMTGKPETKVKVDPELEEKKK